MVDLNKVDKKGRIVETVLISALFLAIGIMIGVYLGMIGVVYVFEMFVGTNSNITIVMDFDEKLMTDYAFEKAGIINNLYNTSYLSQIYTTYYPYINDYSYINDSPYNDSINMSVSDFVNNMSNVSNKYNNNNALKNIK